MIDYTGLAAGLALVAVGLSESWRVLRCEKK